MFLNSSSDEQAPVSEHVPAQNAEPTPVAPAPLGRKILYAIGLPAWVFLGFMLAQAVVLAVISLLQALGVQFELFNAAVFNTVGGAVIYALCILIVLGVPWLVKRRATTMKDLGAQRLPTWLDIAWAPAGAIVYIILTSLVTAFAMNFLPFIDYAQEQETGFAQISSQFEYILAFLSLVVVAPIAEEVLFRGYLFGKLRKYAPLWMTILITSALFALVHFQWNVALDVFALSIVLCLLRVVSGSLWPSILLHMLKNGIAFYFLFINPSLLSTLGG